MTNKTASVEILQVRDHKKEAKEARDFLDRNILESATILQNLELIDLLDWSQTGNNLPNGGPLHIVIEDGNYDDSCVAYCKKAIDDDEYWADILSQEDKQKCHRICDLLAPLTEEQREMIDNGTTITSELFDLLYNQALTGN